MPRFQSTAGATLSPCYIRKLKHYPIFLHLKDRSVLVVGAGKVALRKTKGLLEAGARVTVVAPDVEPEFEDLPVRLVRRRLRRRMRLRGSCASRARQLADRRLDRRREPAAQRRTPQEARRGFVKSRDPCRPRPALPAPDSSSGAAALSPSGIRATSSGPDRWRWPRPWKAPSPTGGTSSSRPARARAKRWRT